MVEVGACRDFQKGYFRLPRREIGYLRFILEGYDGLAFMRTLDSKIGLVEITWPPVRSADVKALLQALAVEVGLEEVATPTVVAPL